MPARAAAIVGLVLLAACGRGGLPPEMAVERVTEELGPRLVAEAGGSAQLAVLQPGGRETGGGAREAVVLPVGTPVRLQLAVPEAAALRFGAGVAGDQQRDSGRSAVEFRVSVDGRLVHRRAVNPSASKRQRRWFDERVELAAWAGTTVEVVLEARAEDPARPLAGTPGWSHVRVVRQQPRPRQRADAGPSVLLVLVDTLRADALGAYGAGAAASPALDAFAATGLVFDTTVAQAAWTMPAVGSIFTGLHPRSHGAVGRGAAVADGAGTMLPESLPTLAELAQDLGVTTVGVSASPVVTAATNMAQGFEQFRELPFDTERRDFAPASAVNQAFLDWLDGAPALRFFAYLHYMEPHEPYSPPPALRPAPPRGIRGDVASGVVHDFARNLDRGIARPPTATEVDYLKRLYAGDVRSWDDAFAGLLAGLRDRGALDRTVVVVIADHGEEFLEHGKLTHGAHLYDESIRVPLVLVGPGVPAGRRADQAQHVDLLPTLAPLLGISAPPGLPGRNLLATFDGVDAISEIVAGFGDDRSRAGTAALRTADRKRIRPPQAPPELYDLAADPGERHDLGATADATALDARLDAWASAAPGPPRGGVADPGFRDRLRQLGYVE